jgi:hypothetical protein
VAGAEFPALRRAGRVRHGLKPRDTQQDGARRKTEQRNPHAHLRAAGRFLHATERTETGIVEEILLDNKRETRAQFFHSGQVLWEKTAFEKTLTLVFKLPVTGVEMEGASISSVRHVQLTTEKRFLFKAGMFAIPRGIRVVLRRSRASGTCAGPRGRTFSASRRARARQRHPWETR